MAVVTRVRKEPSASGDHEHVAGVCNTWNRFYTRAEVIESLDRGDAWITSDGTSSARIRKIANCPFPGCSVALYITTGPDHTPTNNLCNLPPC